MADNVIADAGDSGGATFATDDIGSVHYPITMVSFGALNTATAVSTTNGLPVDLRADNSGGIEAVQDTAADLNCTEASAAAIKTAVELLDNAVDGNYLNTNLNLAGTDVTANAGAVANE